MFHATPLRLVDPTCRPDEYLCLLVADRFGENDLGRFVAWAMGAPLAILGLVVLGVVVRWLVHRLINRLTRRVTDVGRVPGLSNSRRVQRARTVASLLRSITTGVVAAVVTMMVVARLGFDIRPLIASAGILGIAVGLGAQTLIRDFLAGVFMIFEDQYGVGDTVDLGAASGVVEEVGLRVTRIRDSEGGVWYVRNGEITRVGNRSQG